jgi:transglutaminase-like putative cysteine protease
MQKADSSYASRWWDLPSFLIVVLILTTAFSRLLVTRWADNLDTTRIIAYLGLVAGIFIGYSRFSPRMSVLTSLIYGAFVVPWRLGLTVGPGIAWIERLQSLTGRLRVIFAQLFQQRAVSDNLLFITLMCIVFWIISTYAGYTLTRHGNPWVIALPSGLAIVLIHNYDPLPPSRIWYLIIYLFLTLLLVSRLVFVSQRRQWEIKRTYIPSYLGSDIIRFALVACLLLVTLSWSTPALARALPAAKDSWDRVVTPWWNDLRNVFDNAFASLRSTVGLTGEFYGPNLSLGRGNALSDTIIFTVQGPTKPPEGVRFYWRARVYDIYEVGWTSSLQTTHALDAQNINLTQPDMQDNPPGSLSFTFYLNKPITTILAPSQPVWLSRPSQAELAFNPDGTADLGSLRATPSLRSGEIYSVRSSINDPTVEALRAAGTEYPDWVKARYLQLPSTITIRTRQLAAQISQGKETPYEIADAVTQYLRSNYQYSETIDNLPPNQDLIDWFLFDLRKGFCNYYASAEVVLLRTLGIPARLAVGYASGDNIDNPEFYTVRQRDAHAWPEVYFPGIGWIEFEPTVSQPAITRLTEATQAADLNNPTPNQFPNLPLEPEPPLAHNTNTNFSLSTASWQEKLALGFAIALSIFLIGLLISFIRRRELHKKVPLLPIVLEKAMLRVGLKPPRLLRNLSLMASLSPLERAYQQINLALSRLGKRPPPTFTPVERAQNLVEQIPLSKEPARVVIAEYHRATYSLNGNPNHLSARQAGEEIRRLSLRAYIKRHLGI